MAAPLSLDELSETMPLPVDSLTNTCYLSVGELALPIVHGENVVRTCLPVLCIDTEDGQLPQDDDKRGILRLYEPDGTDGVLYTSSRMEIRLRGNTSRRYPKKSYRLKLVDDQGNKRDLSIAGLRSDDDWILNPMYSDTSKIREAVSYWLWSQINSCGQVASSSRVAYAEVLMNGEYYGLYGIQERIDRKQVGADKRTGILYKVTGNDQPSPEELLNCGDTDQCRGIELDFAGKQVLDPWSPAADYMSLLNGEAASGGAELSMANTAEYALWSALVQARDGHFKNMFIHCAPTGDGYGIYRIPWDLNHTLGDLWSDAAEDTNYLTYEVTRIALDDAAAVLLKRGDGTLARAMKERWTALREESITEENILSYAYGLFDRLYPAIERDSQRWPACGMGEGNAANIRDIEDYFRVILPRMDGWIASLSTGE